MRQTAEQDTSVSSMKVKLAWVPYVVFGFSVAVTLVAIFTLSAWAELSGWHHAAQHVMIFTSGFSAGGSILSMFKTKKEQ